MAKTTVGSKNKRKKSTMVKAPRCKTGAKKKVVKKMKETAKNTHTDKKTIRTIKENCDGSRVTYEEEHEQTVDIFKERTCKLSHELHALQSSSEIELIMQSSVTSELVNNLDTLIVEFHKTYGSLLKMKKSGHLSEHILTSFDLYEGCLVCELTMREILESTVVLSADELNIVIRNKLLYNMFCNITPEVRGDNSWDVEFHTYNEIEKDACLRLTVSYGEKSISRLINIYDIDRNTIAAILKSRANSMEKLIRHLKVQDGKKIAEMKDVKGLSSHEIMAYKASKFD